MVQLLGRAILHTVQRHGHYSAWIFYLLVIFIVFFNNKINVPEYHFTRSNSIWEHVLSSANRSNYAEDIILCRLWSLDSHQSPTIELSKQADSFLGGSLPAGENTRTSSLIRVWPRGYSHVWTHEHSSKSTHHGFVQKSTTAPPRQGTV